MRFVGLTAIFLLNIASAAQAEDLISSLANIGDAHSWAKVSVLLALVLVVTFSTLIGVRRGHTAMEQEFQEMERNLSRHQKTEMILKEAHAALESRVRDRTADLEMSYQKVNDVRDLLETANERLFHWHA